MVILKFGGKSLSSKKKIDDICRYVVERSKSQKLIVVVSAMGKTTKKLDDSVKKYIDNYSNPREEAAVLSLGETYSAAIVASRLCSLGIKAISLQAHQAMIYGMGKHLNGVITGINKQHIENCFKYADVVVVTGFQAINTMGEIITLGAGGSDTTAVALGAVFDAEVEIYSDYDGIYHGDPKNLKYKKIKNINYEDILNMAHSGAKVMAEDSVVIAKQNNVKLCCKQSSRPDLEGTNICSVTENVSYIAKKTDLELITINAISKQKFEEIQNYIIKYVNFYKINIENYKIEILIDKNNNGIEEKLAKISDLLEV